MAIGSDVQAYDAGLTDIAALAVTDGNIIVGNGITWVAESGSTARASLGLGSIATQASSSVSISGGSITGITDLAVADGGTGSSTASGARTNLGVAIGSDVQAYDAGLAAIAGLAVTDGNIIVGNGTTWVAESGSTARTSLGLGTAATANVISGVTDTGTAGEVYVVVDSNNNTSYGYLALDALTAGLNNTAIGDSAGTDLTSGSSNTLIGFNAGANINTGSGNVAVGGALNLLQSASNNTAVGFSCLSSATGAGNTGIGYASGGSITTGVNNVCVGYSAGNVAGSELTTGDNCVFIGYQSGTSSPGVDNAVAIGYQAIASQSNEVVLGNASITRTTLQGNVIISGSLTPDPTTATNSLVLGTGTAPTAAGADSIALYSLDLSAGNRTLGIFCEGTPVSSTSPTSPNRTIAIVVNGTTYYLHAKTTND